MPLITGTMSGYVHFTVVTNGDIYLYKVRFFDLEDLYRILKRYFENPEMQAFEELKQDMGCNISSRKVIEFSIDGIELRMKKGKEEFWMWFNNPIFLASYTEGKANERRSRV